MKLKKKGIAMIVVLCVVVLLAGFLLIWFFGARYPKFAQISNTEFKIPALGEKFMPQGLDYIESEDAFLVAGYMANGTPSRVYVVDYKSGEVKKYVTLEINGQDYIGHAGGIAHSGDSVFLVGDKKVEKFSLSTIISVPDKSVVHIDCEFETGNGCDFAYVCGSELIVGEFSNSKNYKPDDSHKFLTTSGEINNALCFAYHINSAKEKGIDDEIVYAISVPEKVQGMCQNSSGEFILSTSYSLPDSQILKYKNIFDIPQSATKINGVDVPLYELSNQYLLDTIVAPTMSEELTLCDGRVFIMFESAGAKYKLFTRTRQKYVVSINI